MSEFTPLYFERPTYIFKGKTVVPPNLKMAVWATESIRWGFDPDGKIYSWEPYAPEEGYWKEVPGLPPGKDGKPEIPSRIACAADGTVVVLAESNEGYLYTPNRTNPPLVYPGHPWTGMGVQWTLIATSGRNWIVGAGLLGNGVELWIGDGQTAPLYDDIWQSYEEGDLAVTPNGQVIGIDYKMRPQVGVLNSKVVEFPKWWPEISTIGASGAGDIWMSWAGSTLMAYDCGALGSKEYLPYVRVRDTKNQSWQVSKMTSGRSQTEFCNISVRDDGGVMVVFHMSGYNKYYTTYVVVPEQDTTKWFPPYKPGKKTDEDAFDSAQDATTANTTATTNTVEK